MLSDELKFRTKSFWLSLIVLLLGMMLTQVGYLTPAIMHPVLVKNQLLYSCHFAREPFLSLSFVSYLFRGELCVSSLAQ